MSDSADEKKHHHHDHHGKHEEKGEHKQVDNPSIKLVAPRPLAGAKRASGLGSTITRDADLQNPVAGGGQRDLWADGNANGCIVYYVGGSYDMLYATDPFNPTTATTQYSTDGGSTWTTVSWSGGMPTTVAATIGSDGAGHWVALCGPSDYPYTSTDGKTFTKSSNAFPGTAGIMSQNIIWYSGGSLFVCASIVSNTQTICTSSDYGVTWVAQTTPNVNTTPPLSTYMDLATDGSTIVMVAGAVTQNPCIYSTNGTTWSLPVSGAPPNGSIPSAIEYSADKGQWFFQDASDGTGYMSTDGQNWSNLGSGFGSAGAISTFWCHDYQQWYMANVDAYNDNNYILLATSDLSRPFQSCILDGSRPAPSGYNVGLYMPKYDRFIIGTSDTAIAFSTARPTTIKSVGDDIRVRNMPVICAKYSTFGNSSANATSTETLLSSPASSLGSLVFQADQPSGMVFDIDFNINVTSAGGDTVTIRYYNNSSVLWNHVLTITAGSSNLPINIRSRVTILGTNIQYNSLATMSGSVPTIASGTTTWAQQPNTVSVTGQWGSSASSLTMNQLIVTTLFPNGA